MREQLTGYAKCIICLLTVICTAYFSPDGFGTALPSTTSLPPATAGKQYTISLTLQNTDYANTCLDYAWVQLPYGFTSDVITGATCPSRGRPPYPASQTFTLTGTPLRIGLQPVQIRVFDSKN